MRKLLGLALALCGLAVFAQTRVRVPVPAKTVDLIATGSFVAFLPDGGCSSRAEVMQAGVTGYEADKSRSLQAERTIPGGLCRGLRDYVVAKVAADYRAPK